MYKQKSEIENSVPFPKGSKVSILSDNNDEYENYFRGYKLSKTIDEDTRFVCIVQDNDCALNVHNASIRNLPFCLVGNQVESVFIRDVLWNETTPFLAKINEPIFIVKEEKDKKEEIEFYVRLIFAMAEKVTQEILVYGEPITSFRQEICSIEYLREKTNEVYSMSKSLNARVDGIKQAESALLLLKIKEKKIFQRADCLVLLAKYLAKVYNYFIKYLPSTLFAPNNNSREEILQEFFNLKNARAKEIVSEYEIRKKYYMISQSQDFLTYVWNKVSAFIEECFLIYRPLAFDHGFCLEEHSEDIKFSTFVAPDILRGETLLSFIKDCGVGDNFI